MAEPVIVASNLVTSVGYLATTACAALRCQITRFEEAGYLDNDLEMIIGSPIPELGTTRSTYERMAQMLSMVLEPIAEYPALVQATTRVPLLMALQEQPRTGADDTFFHELVQRAQSRLHCDPKWGPFIKYGGAPAGFDALAHAADLIKSNAAELCVVGAIDSWLDARSLLWLSTQSPIRTVRGSGIIPGEAAALLLVASSRLVSAAQAQARVLGFGSAIEPAVRNPDLPFRADGLTRAVAQALENSGTRLQDCRLRISDAVDAHNAAKEQMLALSRLLRAPVESLPLWLPAECIGHVGAAAGLVQLIWAIQAGARGYLPGSPVLCTAGNFAGDRAAIVVDVPIQG